jgi:hypothetical protein
MQRLAYLLMINSIRDAFWPRNLEIPHHTTFSQPHSSSASRATAIPSRPPHDRIHQEQMNRLIRSTHDYAMITDANSLTADEPQLALPSPTRSSRSRASNSGTAPYSRLPQGSSTPPDSTETQTISFKVIDLIPQEKFAKSRLSIRADGDNQILIELQHIPTQPDGTIRIFISYCAFYVLY